MSLLPEQKSLLPIGELNQVSELRGRRQAMVTQAIGVIAGSELKRRVTSLEAQRGSIAHAPGLLPG